MLELSPTDSEPGPEPTPGPHSEVAHLRLVLPPGHQEDAYLPDPERPAQPETIASIVEDIKELTELKPGERDLAQYRRVRSYSMLDSRDQEVHFVLMRYGFFDPNARKDSPAEKLYQQELAGRVAGLEIHYPAGVNEIDDEKYATEAYHIDEDTPGNYSLQSLTYDDQGIEARADVPEDDARELLKLLQLLHEGTSLGARSI